MLDSVNFKQEIGPTGTCNTALALTTDTMRRDMADGIIHQKYNRWNPVPKEIEDAVIAFYLEGNSACLAAKRFGVSAQKVLKRRGIHIRPKSEYDKRFEHRYSEVALLYANGKTPKQIKDILGVGKKLIESAINHSGVNRRRIGDYRPRSSGREKDIICLYLTGISAAETGKKIGVCEATVLYVLREGNIEIRKPGISDKTIARGSRGGVSRSKEYVNEKQKNLKAKWKKEKPLYNLMTCLRGRLSGFFRRSKFSKTLNLKKTRSTLQLLGADKETVFSYIENKFQSGMTWDNYGRDGWHVDHIVPLSSAKTEQDLFNLTHYTNLQPLWAIDNHRKHAKLNWKKE